MKILLVFLFILSISASAGDKLPRFAHCLKQCSDQTCTNPPHLSYDESVVQKSPYYTPKSFWLWLFRWNCDSNCDYSCQQIITRERKMAGLEVVQFNGKWPFVRVLGTQELFSVLFSMGNIYVNYKNLPLVFKEIRRNSAKQDWDLVLCYRNNLFLICCSMVAWALSMIFHTRDNNVTETLDYFGAASVILVQFQLVIVRYFNLFKQKNRSVYWIFNGTLVIVYFNHLRILLNDWNYNYNVQFNLVFGLLSNLFWILHCLSIRNIVKTNSYKNSVNILPFESALMKKLNKTPFINLKSTKYLPLIPIFLNLWIIGGMSFELLDFAPLFDLIDAHSLWHLSTILPPIFWYTWSVWELETTKISMQEKE